MVPVRLLHPDKIGEGLFPVVVPVIRAGTVEAGVDQDGEVIQSSRATGQIWIIGQLTLPAYHSGVPDMKSTPVILIDAGEAVVN